MGAGAYMTIVNNTSNPVTNQVTDVNCMFDGGEEGSNLSAFNTTIPANSPFPTGGQSIYIEAKASGSCALETSTFSLTLGVTINESGGMYSAGSYPGNLAVSIDNSQAQAQIVVTVLG